VISCQSGGPMRRNFGIHHSVVSTIRQSPETKTVPAAHINSSKLIAIIDLC
jgi:hypothetical protein